MADKNSSTAPVPRETPIIGASQPSDGAKPKRLRTASIKTSLPASAITLTTDEIRLVAAYRRMNDHGMAWLIRVANALADSDSCRKHKAPSLRLITGSAI